MTTKEEILANVRKKYGFFGCPTRADRIRCPEDIWRSIDWTAKEMEINAALPHHMWGWRQDDRPWPLCRQFRGSNARGPRAKDHGITAKFTPTPPKLVKGRGISRWMAPLNVSVLEIPLMTGYKHTWTPDNIPQELHVIERKVGHENFGKVLMMSKETLFDNYGPSTLQKFSDKSKLLRDPWHFSKHKILKRREKIGVGQDITGVDRVAFVRMGVRWDSLDDYYVRNAIYGGLAWN